MARMFFPLKHQGVLLKDSRGQWMSLDFGQGDDGLLWLIFPAKPDPPQYVSEERTYNCNLDPTVIAQFVRRSPDFNLITHDCIDWTTRFEKKVLKRHGQPR